MRILAGDIGGTTTRLAVFALDHGRLRTLRSEDFPSAVYADLDEVVSEFFARGARPCERACFGIAGPVEGRRVKATNLPWAVDADRLEQRFAIDRVTLINDLEAVAWGVSGLAPDDLRTLNAGSAADRGGNAALIAAGTGLGEAGLYWDGRQLRPFACEGGHASFSPTTDEEWELRSCLSREHGHVSWERVVSGPGLVAIYEFLSERAGESRPALLRGSGDPAAAIVATAADGGSRIARDTLRLFVRLYGAEAGNLALKVMAVGGVYVAGGIAPKIIDWLVQDGFMAGFVNQGRMQSLLEEMPVHVILDERIGLKGAARCGLDG
jgi:glucokinase